jgi:uncharacterized protein involved in exopolysaccharide biosynthesis
MIQERRPVELDSGESPQPQVLSWSIGDVAAAAWRHKWALFTGAILGGAVAAAASFLIPPTYTARTSFLPPQQAQSPAASALASLGALAGSVGGVRTTGDQYIALLQSVSLRNSLVERFQLMEVYDEKLRVDARVELSQNTRLSLGRKDGIVVIEVDDHDRERAANLAKAYVEELQKLSSTLTLTEAQQRRSFFEKQMASVRARLEQAQQQLQVVGISSNAIKAEPKATAEAYAKLRAELTAAEVKLQALRGSLADDTPEVQRQLVTASSLRSELRKLQSSQPEEDTSGYIGAFRELKYHEALFEFIARQYEAAKVDESRDGGQLQLIDHAEVPERKSKPKRSIIGLLGIFIGFCTAAFVVLRRNSRLAT